MKEESASQSTWSSWAIQFIPALYFCLQRGYSIKNFYADVMAGIGVAILAIPLNMAFAIACGLPPEYGLYTAIVAGGLSALFGGSPVAIGGPSANFVVIVYTLLEQHGHGGLATATFMAGIILILMGLIGCGKLLQLISYPVIRGFTSGIAVVLMALQVRDFLGLHPSDPASSNFTATCLANWHCLEGYNPVALLLGSSCLLFLILSRVFLPRFPSYAFVLIGSAILVYLFNLPIDTIGSRFGNVPDSFPRPVLPSLEWHSLQLFFPSAVTIALLCALESLLCAAVADDMAGTRHSSNGELVGQGIGNMGSVLFQGIPASGAIARTTANIRMGGHTPIASLTHAAIMLFVILFLGRYAQQIPLTALAAVLLLVAWQTSEFGRVRALLHAPKGDLIVFTLTFLLTIFTDLTVAVEVGVLFSIFFFIQQLRDIQSFKAYQSSLETPLSNIQEEQDAALLKERLAKLPEHIELLSLHGPLFFGNVDLLQEIHKQLNSSEKHSKDRVWILRMQDVPLIDASGMEALFQFQQTCKRSGVHLVLCELTPALLDSIQKAHGKHFGANQLFLTLNEAIKASRC